MKREYNTEQKRRIIDFLKMNRDRHFTVDEITDSVCGETGSGKSTVYRHIGKLLESGEIRRFEASGSNSFVYQYADVNKACDEHYHLKCVCCGRLIHMECKRLDEVKDHVKAEHDFIIGCDRSVIYGKCASCAAGRVDV